MGNSVRRMASLGIWACCVLAAVLLPQTSAQAETMQPPTRLPTWQCSGAADTRYQVTAFTLDGETLHVEESLDGGARHGWKDLPFWLMGTNFYDERDRGDGKGVVTLSYDLADFAGYRALETGSSFRGDAVQSGGGKRLDWRVRIDVGPYETLLDPVLGEVETVLVTDSRELADGNYSGVRTTWLSPAEGFPVRWDYKDHRGVQSCALVAVN